MAALTVIVPTIGREAKLARVLEALAKQRTGDFELVVSCDAAHPDPAASEALVASQPYPGRVVRAGRPGASAARNAGVAAAGSALLLFLDDDVVPRADLIERHLEWHERHPATEVAVLGRVVWSPEVRVTPFMRWVERGMQFDYDAIAGEEASWAHFYTANVSIKRELIELVGGFDEVRLPYGYEDLDIAKRMHDEQGLRVRFAGDAIGEHLHEMTLDGWRANVARIAPTEREFVAKHPEIPAYFHDLFTAAAERPPARGLGRRVTWLFREPRGHLGTRVWRSADIWYRQQLAPHFLSAWEAADGETAAAPAER